MSEQHKTRDQIFICYRREDSAWVTGRIYDRLVHRFGEETVFKDIDSIPLGINFKQHIDSIIGQCSVVLVVIGDNWIQAGMKNRRIDDPRDYVRIEIESALARDIPVIPLLVQNASMPSPDILPEKLKELPERNGISISNDPHFHVDMNRLIKNLEPYLTPPPTAGVQSLEGTTNEESNQIVEKGDNEHARRSEDTTEPTSGVAPTSDNTSLPPTEQRAPPARIEGIHEIAQNSSEQSTSEDAYVPLLQPIRNIPTVEGAVPLFQNTWSYIVKTLLKRMISRRVPIPFLIVFGTPVILGAILLLIPNSPSNNMNATLEVPTVITPSPSPTPTAARSSSPSAAPTIARSSSPPADPNAKAAVAATPQLSPTINTADVLVQWTYFRSDEICGAVSRKITLTTNEKVFTAITNSTGVAAFQDIPCGASATISFSKGYHLPLSKLNCGNESIDLGAFGVSAFNYLFEVADGTGPLRKLSAEDRKRIKHCSFP